MPVDRIPKPTLGFVSEAELERQYFGGEGWQTVQAGGGGGSQDLAQVLAEGGDPDGNPITGALTINVVGADEFIVDAGFDDPTLKAVGQQVFALQTALGQYGNQDLLNQDALQVYGFTGVGNPLTVLDGVDFDPMFVVGNAGAVGITPKDTNAASFRVNSPVGMLSSIAVISSVENGVGGLTVRKGGGTLLDGAGEVDHAAVDIGSSTTGVLSLWDRDFNNEVLTVGPTGQVTISPRDVGPGEYLFLVKDDTDTLAFGVSKALGGANLLYFADIQSQLVVWNSYQFDDFPTLDVNHVQPNGVLIAAADGYVGFYGTAPIVKPTGVAVNPGAIHAALVSLGLIAA